MKTPQQMLRRGFTLIEIMVATAISLVIVLGVVQIATSSIQAYDSAMSLVSTTAVSRQVLDTLESDIQSSVIRNDGNVWMECLTGTPDLSAATGVDRGACKTLILFSTPVDRDRFKPGTTGASRVEWRGDLCAVRYRLDNANPLPTVLSTDATKDRAFTLNRVVVNPEDTFNQVLAKSADSTNSQTLPQILGSITMDSGTPAARSIQQNNPADIFTMNVVGLTPVFIFKRTDPTKTPSTWFFYAAPNSTLNNSFYQQYFKDGFGSQTAPNTFQGEYFDYLKISGGKYAITANKPGPSDGAWKQGTLTAVIISLAVVDDAGAEEIRALQNRSGQQKLNVEDWNRIMQAHGRTYVRRVTIPGSE